MVLSPTMALYIELAVEALIRRLTSEISELSEDALNERIKTLKAEKKAEMDKINNH